MPVFVLLAKESAKQKNPSAKNLLATFAHILAYDQLTKETAKQKNTSTKNLRATFAYIIEYLPLEKQTSTRATLISAKSLLHKPKYQHVEQKWCGENL